MFLCSYERGRADASRPWFRLCSYFSSEMKSSFDTCHDTKRTFRPITGGSWKQNKTKLMCFQTPGASWDMKRTMRHYSFVGIFSLVFYISGCLAAYEHETETPDWRMRLKTIRNGIHRIDTYLNAALDLFGGDDGLCQYRCSDGEVNVHSIDACQHVNQQQLCAAI